MIKLNLVLCLEFFAVCVYANVVPPGTPLPSPENLGFVNGSVVSIPISEHNFPSMPRPILDEKELADVHHNISTHLEKLRAQENGPHFELAKIHWAYYQTVAGSLWKVKAALVQNKQEKNCTINLYERPWENLVKLNVECGENEKHQWTNAERTKRSSQLVDSDVTIPLIEPYVPIMPEHITEKIVGQPVPVSRKTLDDFHPKMVEAVNTWSASHDFPFTFKHIVSGSIQPVGGTIYNLICELLDKNGNTVEMSAHVLENMQWKIERITFTMPGKTYELTF